MFDRHDIRAAAAQAVAEVERWIDRRHPPRPAGGRRRHKAEPDVEAASRARRPGVAVGLCRTAAGGGEVSVVEASRRPGSGALTLTGRQGEVMRESARTALSWRRANAARYGLDPDLHRDTDVHLHEQSAEVPKEGASAGVTMAAALVSAFTRRSVRTDVAMTGESTHGGQALPVGGIAENRRCPARGTSPPSARRAGWRFPARPGTCPSNAHGASATVSATMAPSASFSSTPVRIASPGMSSSRVASSPRSSAGSPQWPPSVASASV